MLSLLFLQVSKKYVPKEVAKEIHAKAEPFVNWLKEAEEESEGSEEEEEDEEDNVEVNTCIQTWKIYLFPMFYYSYF